MVACGNTEGHRRGEGRAAWSLGVEFQGTGARGGWWRSVGERGSRGRTGMGDRPDRQSRGRGPSCAPGVSRPGGAAAGLFLLGGICRMCS